MAKIKKEPLRECIACRQMFGKKAMVRIVRSPEGVIAVDRTGKASGRGAYICTAPDCAKKLRKNRLLNRMFSCDVAMEVYERVEEELLERQ